MKGLSKKWFLILGVLWIAGYYYMALPAFNIHGKETWFFLFVILLSGILLYFKKAKITPKNWRERKEKKWVGILFLVFVGIYGVGSFFPLQSSMQRSIKS